MINKQQQLIISHYQYIYTMYCKLLCLQYLQNLPSVISILSSEHARGYDWQYAYAAAVARDGRVDINSRIDPEGRVVAVAYGGSGRASGVTNALGHTTNYTFDYIKARKEFYLKTSYPGGRVTETWYERDGEVKRRDINGINIITITEDLRKDIATDTFGRVTTKEYDEFKNLLKTTYPDGTSTSTTYDVSNSNVLTKADERGTVTKYEYWPNGRLKKMTEAFGTSVERSTEYIYDQYGQTLTKTQVGDAVTVTAISQYFFDEFGNIIKFIDAENNEVTVTNYNSQGDMLNLITVENNNQWLYEYDKLGYLKSETSPLLIKYSYTYDKVGNLIKQINPDLTEIQYKYNLYNKLEKEIDEVGFEIVYKYDVANNLINLKSGNNSEVIFTYDLLGRKIEKQDGFGNITKYIYPDINQNIYNATTIYRPISIEFPKYKKTFKYDLMGRYIEIQKQYSRQGVEKNEIFKVKYDNSGNILITTDPINNTIVSEYDVLDRRINKVESQLTRISYIYDNRNNIVEQIYNNNKSYYLTYDKLDQLVEYRRPNGNKTIFNYDENKNLINRMDANGQFVEYFYDKDNREKEVRYLDKDRNLEKSVIFQVNTMGTIIGYNDGTSHAIYEYNDAQQMIQTILTHDNETFKFNNTYHPNGQEASFTNIDNTEYKFYYNNENLLNNIVIPNEGNISFQDFEVDFPRKISYPGGITRINDIDGLSMLTSFNVKNILNQDMISQEYSYSENGNITSINTDIGNYQYDYDNLNRIKQANYPNSQTELFTYDDYSNRKTHSKTGLSEWLYNNNNQLINSINNQFLYDENGNQIELKDSSGVVTKFYKYSSQNRLVSIEDANRNIIASYYYDPFGNRLSKTIYNLDGSTSKTYFVYGDSGLIAEKKDSQITTYLFHPEYIWSTNPVLKRINSTYYYYQNDHLDVVKLLHDKDGNIVSRKDLTAFGGVNNIINLIDDNLTFPGQYYDEEDDSYYNHYRNYKANLGRYIQEDPLGIFAGDNVYNYPLNPISSFDNHGLRNGSKKKNGKGKRKGKGKGNGNSKKKRLKKQLKDLRERISESLMRQKCNDCLYDQLLEKQKRLLAEFESIVDQLKDIQNRDCFICAPGDHGLTCLEWMCIYISDDCDYPYYITVHNEVVGPPGVQFPGEHDLADNCVCRKTHAGPYQLPGL